MPDEILDVSTPVLVMGGLQNALSIVRSLGRAGAKVSVSSTSNCFASHSRYCADSFPVFADASQNAFWEKLLLSEKKPLEGSMLLTCSAREIQQDTSARKAFPIFPLPNAIHPLELAA